MNDRYHVAIGYPDERRPDGMSIVRVTGYLSTSQFATWAELLVTRAARDKRDHEFTAHAARTTMPPAGGELAVFDVRIHRMTMSDRITDFIVGMCSRVTINELVEFLLFQTAVADEREAENDGAM